MEKHLVFLERFDGVSVYSFNELPIGGGQQPS